MGASSPNSNPCGSGAAGCKDSDSCAAKTCCKDIKLETPAKKGVFISVILFLFLAIFITAWILFFLSINEYGPSYEQYPYGGVYWGLLSSLVLLRIAMIKCGDWLFTPEEVAATTLQSKQNPIPLVFALVALIFSLSAFIAVLTNLPIYNDTDTGWKPVLMLLTVLGITLYLYIGTKPYFDKLNGKYKPLSETSHKEIELPEVDNTSGGGNTKQDADYLALGDEVNINVGTSSASDETSTATTGKEVAEKEGLVQSQEHSAAEDLRKGMKATGCLLWCIFSYLMMFVIHLIFCITMISVVLSSIHSLKLITNYNRYSIGSRSGFDEYLVGLDAGYSVYFRCQGEVKNGSPTIIMWHGWMGNSLDFSWVQKEISNLTRTCAFDRPGYGLSRKMGSLPRTSERIAQEVYESLDHLDIDNRTNLMFVGHSFAGFNMRKFIDLYPGVVQGIVMVDTVNPNATSQCNDPDKDYVADNLYALAITGTELGAIRIIDWTGIVHDLAPLDQLPGDKYEEYLEPPNRPGYWITVMEEWRRWGTSCASIPRYYPNNTLDMPLSIIIPDKSYYGDKTFMEEQALLSPEGRYVHVNSTVPGVRADHVTILFNEVYAQYTIKEAIRVFNRITGN